MQIAEISVLTVLGAVCIYVLLGLSFAFVYEAVGDPGSQPLFASREGGTRSDYVYFSFITMATVGYGDLSLKAACGASIQWGVDTGRLTERVAARMVRWMVSADENTAAIRERYLERNRLVS